MEARGNIGAQDSAYHPIRTAVLVTATEPEPRSFGKRVVLGGITDYLVGRLGSDCVTVIQVGALDARRPPIACRRVLVAKPGPREQVKSVVGIALPPHRSLQEAALFSPRLARDLRQALGAVDADLEVWDTVRLGQYASQMPRARRRILYVDDLFSRRYETMLDQFHGRGTSSGVSPLGEFRHMLPGAAARILDHRAVYRPLLRVESRLVARSERRQPADFDAALLVSQEETAALQAMTGLDSVLTLPPRLREPKWVPRRYCGPPTAVLLGSLSFAPNLDGLTWFLRACRDEVLAKVPDLHLLVVGPGTEAGVVEAGEWGGRVSFLGYVDNLDALLAEVGVLLSPLRVGSGVKIKVLEALARGLPVVATPAGVQGINAGSERGILVANSPVALAEALHEALDVGRNAQLSEAARAHWELEYAPSVLASVYSDALGIAR